MKRITISMATLIMALSIYAQVPLTFKYQAVARDASGNLISNQSVTFRISILQGTASGTVVYSETHSATTNLYGLVSLAIGGGDILSGEFLAIDWGSESHFIQVEMDEYGGSDFQIMGISQLLSVPYSIHAASVDEHDWKKDTDGIFYDDGNVGINGSADPVHDLFVQGTIKSDGGLYWSSDTCGIWVADKKFIQWENEGIAIGYNAGLTGLNHSVAIGTRALGDANSNVGAVAIGYGALSVQNGGSMNTGIGSDVLMNLSFGDYNTAIGGHAGINLNGAIANSYNTLIGQGAGVYEGDGTTPLVDLMSAVFVGKDATTGSLDAGVDLPQNEIVIGYSAIGHNSHTATIGNSDVTDLWANQNGDATLHSGGILLSADTAGIYHEGVKTFHVTGFRSTFLGENAGNAAGVHNNYQVGIGYQALNAANDAGTNYNTAIGASALQNLDIGQNNVAIGYRAMRDGNNGFSNVAIGNSALINIAGGGNTVVGKDAAGNMINGNENVIVGTDAASYQPRGSEQTVVGTKALRYIDDEFTMETSNYNVALGASTGNFLNDGVTKILIGEALTYLGAYQTSGGTAGQPLGNEIGIGYKTKMHGSNTATIGNDAVTDVWMNENGTANIHGGTVVLSAETEPEPLNNMMYFLNEVNSDPDTIAVYNGTAWKYFISQ